MKTRSFIVLYSFWLGNYGVWADMNYDLGANVLWSNNSNILQHSQNISSESLCSDWCKKDQAIQISENYFRGLVKFIILPAPSICNYSEYLIELFLQRNGKFNIFNKLTNLLNLCSSEVCKEGFPKELELKMDNISQGLYYLSITPYTSTGIGMKCSSNNFTINLEPTVHYTGYEKDGSELLDIIFSFKSILTGPLPEAVIISLNSGIPMGLEDCSFTGNKEACCVVGIDDDYCSSYQKMCSCEWKNSMLDCKFENTATGNYCVMVEFRDHRCHNDVLCNWHNPLVLKASKINPTVLTHVPTGSPVLWVIAIVITSLFLLTGISVILKRKYFVKRNQSLPLVITKPAPEGEKPKVLLAYPRDCPLFMGTMAEFRKILKEILNVEVYDAWDSDIWEFVAEKKDRWGLHYCYDHNVKVILMATHCSRFIQDALLNGDKIEYSDPEPFDNIFIGILKCITQMVTEFTYKRIFVVRVDGTDCEENTFKYINPFTIYTIPQQLYALGHALWNSEHNEAYSSLTVTSLSSLIEKLNKYKSDNPYYFKHMIQIKKEEE